MSARADKTADIGIIGAGLVGSALAHGFAKSGAKVCVLDAAEDDFHASAGNFGLVWVQGKGQGAPDYAALSRRSADAWERFADELAEMSGIATQYRRTGGVKIALGEDELAEFSASLMRMHNQPGGDNDTRMIDRAELEELVPGIGPDVVGGTHCPHDGHADPLLTLRALRQALKARVRFVPGKVLAIEPIAGGGFTIVSAGGPVVVDRVVLAAGLGNAALAGPLGLDGRVRPQRGQILVTQRVPSFLDIACHNIRQTADGSVLLGDSKEEVGFDRGTTPAVASTIATRAVRMFPALADVPLVRSWGALRVMSPDGLPIYQSSTRFPGAFLVTCHSGVTLAAVHAGEVAQAILDDRVEETYPAFAPTRFEVAA
jgi:hydrogen cyanide synthase HcnC